MGHSEAGVIFQNGLVWKQRNKVFIFLDRPVMRHGLLLGRGQDLGQSSFLKPRPVLREALTCQLSSDTAGIGRMGVIVLKKCRLWWHTTVSTADREKISQFLDNVVMYNKT